MSANTELTTIAKRIQTRLSKKGISVSLSEIKPICQSMIANINSPLETEMTLIVNHFLDTNNALTVNVESTQEEIEQSTPAPLTTTQSNKLVAGTAHQMGIVLNAGEIAEIAENLNESTSSFEDDIDSIRNAILAFVRHKAQLAQSKIDQMVDEVREAVSQENQANTARLSSGLTAISSDIQEANKDFKSQVSKALSAFALPAVKAG